MPGKKTSIAGDAMSASSAANAEVDSGPQNRGGDGTPSLFDLASNLPPPPKLPAYKCPIAKRQPFKPVSLERSLGFNVRRPPLLSSPPPSTIRVIGKPPKKRKRPPSTQTTPETHKDPDLRKPSATRTRQAKQEKPPSYPRHLLESSNTLSEDVRTSHRVEVKDQSTVEANLEDSFGHYISSFDEPDPFAGSDADSDAGVCEPAPTTQLAFAGQNSLFAPTFGEGDVFGETSHSAINYERKLGSVSYLSTKQPNSRENALAMVAADAWETSQHVWVGSDDGVTGDEGPPQYNTLDINSEIWGLQEVADDGVIIWRDSIECVHGNWHDNSRSDALTPEKAEVAQETDAVVREDPLARNGENEGLELPEDPSKLCPHQSASIPQKRANANRESTRNSTSTQFFASVGGDEDPDWAFAELRTANFSRLPYKGFCVGCAGVRSTDQGGFSSTANNARLESVTAADSVGQEGTADEGPLPALGAAPIVTNYDSVALSTLENANHLMGATDARTPTCLINALTTGDVAIPTETNPATTLPRENLKPLDPVLPSDPPLTRLRQTVTDYHSHTSSPQHSSKGPLDFNIPPISEYVIKNELDGVDPLLQLGHPDFSLPPDIVTAYEKEGIVEMYEWQRECLLTNGVLTGNRNIVYSAPTGAGKTLISDIILLRRLLSARAAAATGSSSRCRGMVVLPYVSVAAERKKQMETVFGKCGISVHCFFGTGGSQVAGMDDWDVDEAHMVADSSRGYILELLVTKCIYGAGRGNCQLVAMSATIPNIQLLASWLNAGLFVTGFRPVPVTEHVYIEGKLYDPNLNEERVLCRDLPKSDPDGLFPLVNETTGGGHSVLVFCPTKKLCESAAMLMGKLAQDPLDSDAVGPRTQLVMELSRTPGGLDPVLEITVPKGIAYHHSGLTAEERELIEQAFHAGILNVLTATSTLASGVNLPARRVIFRAPYVAREILDAGSYVQMKGRAGRKGKDTKGESVIMCKQNQLDDVRTLLASKLQPITSCLTHDMKGMKRALMEVIATRMVKTESDVIDYLECTLLYAEERGNKDASPVVMREEASKGGGFILGKAWASARSALHYLTDQEMVTRVDSGSMLHLGHFENQSEQRSFESPSPGVAYTATRLGIATMASSLSPEESMWAYQELKSAQTHFVLEDELHVVYHVTPIYYLPPPNWKRFFDIWLTMSEVKKLVLAALGVNNAESIILTLRRNSKAADKFPVEDVMRLTRFYVSMMLHDLIKEVPFIEIIQRYDVNRGILQQLQTQSATFAGMITIFCERLGWNLMRLILHQLQERLSFGIENELLELVRIPHVKGTGARLLWKAGLRTLAAVACSTPNEIFHHLSEGRPFQSTKRSIDGPSNEDYQRRIEYRAAHSIVQAARCMMESESPYGKTKTKEDKSATVGFRPLLALWGRQQGLREIDCMVPIKTPLADPGITVPGIDSSPSSIAVGSQVTRAIIRSVHPGSITIAGQAKAQVASRETSAGLAKSGHLGMSNVEMAFSEAGQSKSMDNEKANINATGRPQLCSGSFPIGSSSKFQRAPILDLKPNNVPQSFERLNVMEDREQFEIFLREWSENATWVFSIATLTKGDNTVMTGLAISYAPGYVCYLDVESPLWDWSVIRQRFRDTGVFKIAFDMKLHMKHLIRNGTSARAWLMDPRVASWCLNHDEEEKPLSKLLEQHLPLLNIKRGPRTPSDVACFEVHQVWFLMTHLATRLDQQCMLDHFLNIEMSLNYILAVMEETGVGFVPHSFTNHWAVFSRRLQELEREAYNLAGHVFALTNPAQVAVVLFDELQLEIVDQGGNFKDPKTATVNTGFDVRPSRSVRRSTSKEILVNLAAQGHRLAAIVLEHRRISSIVSKHLFPLQHAKVRSEHFDMYRVHTTYVMNTSTGRVCTNNPNLQNIPHPIAPAPPDMPWELHTVESVNLRDALQASDSCMLLSADYSQLELRLIAHLSQDPSLKQLLCSGGDLFRLIAAQWLSIPVEQVTTSARKQAKTVTYGVMYGIGPSNLAEQLGSTVPEAERFIVGMKNRFPGFQRFVEQTIKNCEERGWVQTVLGRRRWLPAIHSHNIGERSHAQRQAVNTTVQGSAADLVKVAMIKVAEQFRIRYGCWFEVDDVNVTPARQVPHLVLQIHDELLFEVPESILEEVKGIVAHCMSTAITLSVPLPVNISAAKSWGQASL
ncbi:hypothetical protein HDU93_006542 [Gonapodya sp. JEL0774]|nr:hypothetical protein HDU93_006542 [Gonapodya sp. JEL0774]